MNVAIILAGGFGTRLFPLSRQNYPKQFIKIFNRKSLIEITYKRLKDINIFDEIFVCVNKKHFHLVKRDLDLGDERIIVENESRNTAFAILYSVFKIHNLLGTELVSDKLFLFFFPSDHYITDDKEFGNTIKEIAKYLNLYKKVFIIGIKPKFPSTDYGYIKKSISIDKNLYKVGKFIEKPSKSKARYYFKNPNYLWNLGIYAFNSDFFISDFFKINRHLEKFMNLEALEKEAQNFPNISIDYIYSQKSKNLVVVEGKFEWLDLGNFEEISKVVDSNLKKIINLNSDIRVVFDELEIQSPKKYCFINVKDLIMVETKDFQVIAKKGDGKKISEILRDIEEEQREYNVFDFRPWGYYKEIDKNKQYRIKKIIIYPFQELSLQYHNYRDEYWIILNGKGKVFINNSWLDISKGKFICIPRGVVHKVLNTGNEYLEIIEVQLGEVLSEKDIIRLEDKYGRQ